MDPIPGWAERLWDAWDIRILVLLSFVLQIILTSLGSRRKYIARIWVRIIVWSAYLMADSVATFALGNLSQVSNSVYKQNGNTSNSGNTALMALWAPLLLLHLGGPDTITAYSVEDNQLWIRHLLGLAVQAVVAIYVILRRWTDSFLFYLTFPLFLAGIIKYGERAWALRSSMRKPLYMNDLKKEVEYHSTTNIPGVKLLLKAFYLFDDFKPQIVNRHFPCLSSSRSKEPFSLPKDGCSSGDVFKISEIELGFMFDVLYTKSTIIYTRVGCIFRIISLVCIVYVLWGFSFATKPAHVDVDIAITYVLLAGAVLLEIRAFMLVICSDWAILWMIKHHEKWLVAQLLRVLAPHYLGKRRRWSNSMGQFNLLSYCLCDEPKKLGRILKLFGIDEEFKKHRLKTFVDVPKGLKELIVQMVMEMEAQRSGEQSFPKRGRWALERYKCLEAFEWSVQIEFDKSITLWHIVTDICYYSDDCRSSTDSPSRMTKLLSDYMMYLLIVCPYMLAITTAVGDKIFQDTCDRVMEMFRDKPCMREKKEACKMILGIEEATTDGSISKWNILPSGQELARTLMDKEDKWKIISRVWVEMLCYAACHCQVNYHAQHLRRGGELITNVWLLLLPMTAHPSKT